MPRKSQSGLPFLVRRGDTGKYTYWRNLPSEIAMHFFGDIDLPWVTTPFAFETPKIVKVSLRTGDEKTARERWGHINAQVDTLCRAALDRGKQKTKDAAAIEKLKLVRTLTPHQIATIGAQARHDVRSEDDKVWEDPNYLSPVASIIFNGLLHAGMKNTPELRDSARQQARDLDKRTSEKAIKARLLGPLDQDHLLARVDTTSAKAQNAADDPEMILGKSELTRRLEENGLELPKGTLDRHMLGHAVLRAKLGGFQDFDKLRRGEHIETMPRPAPIVERGITSAANNTKTLSQMHTVWAELERPGRKAIDDSKLYVDRFIALHSDLDMRAIDRTHMRVFRDTMAKFPRNTPRHLDTASPTEIVEWRERHPSVPLLSRRTVNQKAIGTLSKLFNKAIGEGYADANPCTHVKFNLKESDKTIRVSFDEQDLSRLFASPVYADPTYRPKGGCGEAAFWLPLLSLYSGARLEELGQLLVADIKIFEHIDFIDITTIEDPGENEVGVNAGAPLKSLKTTSSKRMVPLHPILVDAGFLDFVSERRRLKGRMLFPELVPYRDRYTKNWGRWWGRYQNQHVNASKDRVFHSFRHSFKDAMSNAKVHPDVMKAVLGHANADVTDAYGIGPALRIRHEELQKVSYPGLDIAKISRNFRPNESVSEP